MSENEQERWYKGMIKGLMKVASGERLKSGFSGLIMEEPLSSFSEE